MAQFTRQVIQESFMKLLNERPLSRISVLDIVNECGVSRNTFYYHFQDIPDLVDSITKIFFDELLKKHPKIESVSDCITAITSVWISKKKAVLHIYKSLNRNIFETYHWRTCEYVVTVYLDSITKDVEISADDRRILINYMKSVCFGIVIFWLDNNLNDQIYADMQRICEIKQGDLKKLIDKCRTI